MITCARTETYQDGILPFVCSLFMVTVHWELSKLSSFCVELPHFSVISVCRKLCSCKGMNRDANISCQRFGHFWALCASVIYLPHPSIFVCMIPQDRACPWPTGKRGLHGQQKHFRSDSSKVSHLGWYLRTANSSQTLILCTVLCTQKIAQNRLRYSDQGQWAWAWYPYRSLFRVSACLIQSPSPEQITGVLLSKWAQGLWGKLSLTTDTLELLLFCGIRRFQHSCAFVSFNLRIMSLMRPFTVKAVACVSNLCKKPQQ